MYISGKNLKSFWTKFIKIGYSVTLQMLQKVKNTNKKFKYNSMIVQLRSLRPNFKGEFYEIF